MKALLLILWLLLSVACSKPGNSARANKEAGLDETTAWLKLKLPAYATNTSVSSTGWTERKLTWLDSNSPCTLSWQQESTRSYTWVIKLRVVVPSDKIDVKLSEVRETSSDDGKLWELYLRTTDQQQVIDFDGEQRFLPNPPEPVAPHSDTATIAFTSPEIANRIKAAFDHAAGLCSKRPSEPF